MKLNPNPKCKRGKSRSHVSERLGYVICVCGTVVQAPGESRRDAATWDVINVLHSSPAGSVPKRVYSSIAPHPTLSPKSPRGSLARW